MSKTALTRKIEEALMRWHPTNYGGYRVDKFRDELSAFEVPVESGSIKSGLVDYVCVQECFVSECKTEICKLNSLKEAHPEKTIQDISKLAEAAQCQKDFHSTDFFSETCEHKFCHYHKTIHEYEVDSVIVCVEIKISVSDFHSKHGHNFAGNCNYYAIPSEMYSKVKDKIPEDVGVLLYLQNGTIRKKVECKPKTLSERQQKQLILSVAKRIQKQRISEIRDLEQEVLLTSLGLK